MPKIVITKEKFDAYEDVKKSGATNMFNIQVVEDLSELSRAEITEIMANYSDYLKEFSK